MDINCAVCGEPWDAYGVRHGDVLPWEGALFLRGAGCPSCEGVAGEDADANAIEHVRQRVIDVPFDDDVTGGIEILEDARPKWERPAPRVVEGCTCAGCGVSVALDPDDNAPIWHGGKKVFHTGGPYPVAYGQSYYGSRDDEDAADYADPAEWLKIAEEPYCPGCAELCDECGETVISKRAELAPDMYDPGYAWPRPGRSYYSSAQVCGACVEECERQEEESTRPMVIDDAVRALPEDLRDALDDMDVATEESTIAEAFEALEVRGDVEWYHSSEGAWANVDGDAFADVIREKVQK